MVPVCLPERKLQHPRVAQGGGRGAECSLKEQVVGKGARKGLLCRENSQPGAEGKKQQGGVEGGYSLPGSSMDTLLPQLLREPLSSHLRREMKPKSCRSGYRGWAAAGECSGSGSRLCLSSPQDANNNLCYSTFEVMGDTMTESQTWILGDVFLKVYFTVFDRGQNRIGLARAA